MNSIGALSPAVRDATTLVAGNALGEILIDVRVRVLLMTSDAIDTKEQSCQRQVLAYQWQREGAARRARSKAGDNPQRFWSLRYSAAPSSGLLEMLPMIKRQGSTASPKGGKAGRDRASYRGIEATA